MITALMPLNCCIYLIYHFYERQTRLLDKKPLVDSYLKQGPQALIQFFFCQFICLV